MEPGVGKNALEFFACVSRVIRDGIVVFQRDPLYTAQEGGACRKENLVFPTFAVYFQEIAAVDTMSRKDVR